MFLRHMNRIRQIREGKGLTQDQLAERMGTRGATIHRLEVGKMELTEKWMRRFKDALDVPIPELLEEPEHHAPLGVELKGEIRAGAWLELDEHREAESPLYIDVMPDKRFPGARQFALKVIGTSMNKFIQPGSYVIVADWADLGLLEPREDDVLVIRRQRAMTYEITLKRARRGADGWEFWPESTDPRYQEPISMADGDRDVEVTIVGLVVGRYIPS